MNNRLIKSLIAILVVATLLMAYQPVTKAASQEFYYFIYNGSKISKADFSAMKSYIEKFKTTSNVIVDVSNIKIAAEIYDKLKTDASKRSGVLKGIQIFGATEDVPAFTTSGDIYFKQPNRALSKFDHVERGDSYLTDYFYSNFKNDSSELKKKIGPYQIFNEKSVKLDLIPEWKVVRLPLSKGEFEGYFKKYYDYLSKRKAQGIVPVVNFASPTFANIPYDDQDSIEFRDPNNNNRLLYQKDDNSYFIQRLAEEFHVIDNYRLYGNQQGDVKVRSKIIGDYTAANIAKENKTGIVDFVFSSHAQFNITKLTLRDNGPDKPPIIIEDRAQHAMTQKTMNKILSSNYYTALLNECDDAFNLSNTSIAHDMIANGKAVQVFASSHNLAGNGLNNVATLEDQKTTWYYFMYWFYRNQHDGQNLTDSFFNAIKTFESEAIKQQDKIWDPNFESAIINILAVHSLGVIAY